MRFVDSPNLPRSDVKLAAVSAAYPDVIRSLGRLGIAVIPVPPCDRLRGPVGNHPDALCHHLGGGRIVAAAGNRELRKQLAARGFSVLESDSVIQGPYPGDSALNAARVGGRLIANVKILDGAILRFCRDAGIAIIPVRQGYAKCSVAVADENSIITSDRGIAKAVREAGLEALLIEPGSILLPGCESGFIGGACGKIGGNKMAFAGRIQDHPDYARIADFLGERNIAPIALTDGPLSDIGGILPLAESER